MAPKTKGITEGSVDFPFLGLVQGKIELLVNLRVRCLKIDRGRDSLVFNCQNGSDGLYGTGSPQQVSRH